MRAIAWVYGWLALSLVANLLLTVSLHNREADYNRLLVWACEAGNGGHECGED